MLLRCNLKSVILATGCIISAQLFAGTMGETTLQSGPWFLAGSIGYTDYQNMYHSDGQTAIARLAIGRDVMQYQKLTWGIEVGYQNGNTMRLDVPQTSLDILGGLPIQSRVKPMLDLLVDLKFSNFANTPIVALVKGGIAYRSWEFLDRSSIADQNKIAGTVQAGLGYQISDHSLLSLMYQGVYGGNPNFTVYPSTLTASVSNIPVQNGVLLGVTYSL